MRITFFLILLLSAGRVLAQPEDPKAKPQVLFSVSGNDVTTDEFSYLFKKNHSKKEEYTEAKINEYLNLLITFKMKVAEARLRGYDTTSTFSKEFRTYREELKKPYVASTDQLDRLTREAYERMKVEIKASHILVSPKPGSSPADTLAAYNKLLNIRGRLIKGEDFTKLAKEYSDEPGSKINGGELPYFTVLQMVYPFEQAVYALETGQISNPVKTRFGYHLIKVTDKRLAKGEVEVSHIILRTGTADDKKLKGKIFEIHQQLQSGRSWDELCKEYSDDQGTKNSGGRLRPFGIGALAGVPEFEAMAFSLHAPGEVSDPFQSTYGWHIVRLERRIPIPPYEQVAESLRKRVSRDERLQLANKETMLERRKAFDFAEQTETKKAVFGYADSTLQKGAWHYRGDKSLLDRNLFSIRGNNSTVSQFVTYAVKEQTQNAQSPATYMGLLYDQFVKGKMDDFEEGDLAKANPEYRNLVQEYREGILLFTVMEKEVWNKASEDTAGLKLFYESNKGKYRSGERVRAKVFAADDSAFVQAIQKKVTKGDSISRAELRKFKAVQGPRNFAPGESKAVDRAPKVIGLHTVRVDNTFYMIQIDNLVPPGIRTLEEIRSQVISDYQDNLEKKWVTALKAKYPARINSKSKKFVVRELTKP